MKVLGIALPWAAFRGFVYDGGPFLVGGAVTLLLAPVLGGVVGGLVVPAVILSVYWIAWRIAGRP